MVPSMDELDLFKNLENSLKKQLQKKKWKHNCTMNMIP